MRGSLKAMLVIAMICGGSIAGAQVQPVPEEQLARGFLGEQNARLTGQDAPADAHYSTRAAAALAGKDYARALAILRPYRRTHTPVYHFLAGQAHQGLGDYASARRDYGEAIRLRKTFIGGQLALGLLEAKHGDRAAAVKILQELKTRQAKCGGQCREVSDLGASVDAIEAALLARPA